MNVFHGLLDRLWLLAVTLYAVNRWLVKPLGVTGFMHDHFNDLLLVPAALPLVLALHRRLGWRRHEGSPSAMEVALHVGVWALVCEGLGPALFHRGVADPLDVVAYATGGVIAWAWWNRAELRHSIARLGGL